MVVKPENPYEPEKMEEARRLRTEFGMPMKQIAALLDVSPGTVHAWTSDIVLPEEYVKRNKAFCHDAARTAWVKMNRDRRQAAQDQSGNVPNSVSRNTSRAACSIGPRAPRIEIS